MYLFTNSPATKAEQSAANQNALRFDPPPPELMTYIEPEAMTGHLNLPEIS